VDLPGGAQIGREITAAAGLSDRVEHMEGDITADDLPRGVDAVLLFQIVHHFSAEQNRSLIRRAWQALNPAGAVAVLDYFDPPPGHKPDSGSFLGLHFYLTSGVGTYSAHELMDWLSDGGFEAIRSARLKSIPLQELYQARKPVNQ
jgi:SAM-dependent methyltransferase